MATTGADVVDMIEPKIAFLLVLAMALKALLSQERADLHLKKLGSFGILGRDSETGGQQKGKREERTTPLGMGEKGFHRTINIRQKHLIFGQEYPLKGRVIAGGGVDSEGFGGHFEILAGSDRTGKNGFDGLVFAAVEFEDKHAVEIGAAEFLEKPRPINTAIARGEVVVAMPVVIVHVHHFEVTGEFLNDDIQLTSEVSVAGV
jgi:hypothetical protein